MARSTYAEALDRLDYLVVAAQNRVDEAEGSDMVKTIFPHKIDEARLMLNTAMRAREVADPHFVAWVTTSKRGKAHAVRDFASLTSLCGRDITGGSESSAARCTRCVSTASED